MTAVSGASAPPLDDLTTLLRQAQAGDHRVYPALKTHMDATQRIGCSKGISAGNPRPPDHAAQRRRSGAARGHHPLV